MKEIEAFVFDADGVVINKKWMFSQILEKEYGLTFDDTQDFFKGPFQKCLIGTGDLKELLPEYLEKWEWEGSVDDFLNLWFTSEHHIDDDLIKEINVLRERGYKIYMATNQEKYRVAYMRSEMGFDHSFDKIFYSAAIGFVKPQKDFFDAISEEIGTTSVCFWDDDEKNVIGAKEAGWQAIHYGSIDDFFKVINK